MAAPPEPVRRRLLAAGLSAGAMALLPADLLAALLATPRQPRGPFYPLTLPLDRDNDLVRVEGRPGLAQGEITNVVGRVLDTEGRPVAGARVEIWQCNAFGRYHHEHDNQRAPIDPNFQGYGQFVTGEDGAYRFRTIKPVAYPGRAPHIHFAITGPGIAPLVTQMYVAGAPENERDFLLNSIGSEPARRSLIVALDTRTAGNERVGRFDIVVRRA
ncbi:MAG TPA: protocatechuate 3,4-dioxygenase [Pelomicrobium sp.]|nr:protocatechuate 3,4-dioxygenase [Pelomicrobium sp.]